MDHTTSICEALKTIADMERVRLYGLSTALQCNFLIFLLAAGHASSNNNGMIFFDVKSDVAYKIIELNTTDGGRSQMFRFHKSAVNHLVNRSNMLPRMETDEAMCDDLHRHITIDDERAIARGQFKIQFYQSQRKSPTKMVPVSYDAAYEKILASLMDVVPTYPSSPESEYSFYTALSRSSSSMSQDLMGGSSPSKTRAIMQGSYVFTKVGKVSVTTMTLSQARKLDRLIRSRRS